MGNAPASDTPFGRSFYGKVYKTLVPVTLRFNPSLEAINFAMNNNMKYSNKEDDMMMTITTYREFEHVYPGPNDTKKEKEFMKSMDFSISRIPQIGHFKIKVNPGLMFIVTDVVEDIHLKTSSTARFRVKILNDIPIDEKTKLFISSYTILSKDPIQINNPKLREIDYFKNEMLEKDIKTTPSISEHALLNTIFNKERTLLKLRGVDMFICDKAFINTDSYSIKFKESSSFNEHMLEEIMF